MQNSCVPTTRPMLLVASIANVTAGLMSEYASRINVQKGFGLDTATRRRSGSRNHRYDSDPVGQGDQQKSARRMHRTGGSSNVNHKLCCGSARARR